MKGLGIAHRAPLHHAQAWPQAHSPVIMLLHPLERNHTMPWPAPPDTRSMPEQQGLCGRNNCHLVGGYMAFKHLNSLSTSRKLFNLIIPWPSISPAKARGLSLE